MLEYDLPSDEFDAEQDALFDEEALRYALQYVDEHTDDKKKQVLIRKYFGQMVLDTSHVTDNDLLAVYQELNWFLQIVWARYQHKEDKADFSQFFEQPDFNNTSIALPKLPNKSHYSTWLKKHQLTNQAPERLLLAMAMALSLNDAMFFAFIELLQQPLISVFVGGQTQDNERRFLPTMQSLLYLLAGIDLTNQAAYQRRFRTQQNRLSKWGVELLINQPKVSGRNSLTDEWKNHLITLQPDIWQYFLGGNMPLPEENQDLPITKLTTSLTYDDLVVDERVKTELQPLVEFAENGRAFFNDPAASAGYKQGFITLLYGPPGTGKTMIATTIGKELGLVTYQLELAQVISKYIGETSKNINKVFEELEKAIDHLKGEPSILFVDEADALMGKRSEVKDSKDRYANIDVSNLLQKLETFPGLVILASNHTENLDPAIKRRIGAMVLVPPPEADERTQLWKNYKPARLAYPTDNFARILGERFRLTGAQINNILKQVAMSTYTKQVKVIDFDKHLEGFIRNEFMKNDEVYVRPRDLMNASQVDEAVYLQQLMWERALPHKWRYNPLYMPRILSQAIILAEADIKEMVKKVKRKWEGGPYHDLPFKEGIEVVLRDLCAVKALNWNEIQAKIYELLAIEKNKGKNKETAQSDNPNERTVQLVDLSKLKEMGRQKDEEAKAGKSAQQADEQENKKEALQPLTAKEKAAQAKARKEAEAQAQLERKQAAEEKKLKKILSASEAEGFWAKELPKGFAFARKDMVKNMAQIYVLSKWHITKIVEEAAKLAKADNKHETKPNGDIAIGASHLQVAMDVVAAELGKEKGEKLDRDYFLRQDLKEQRQKEKEKSEKRRSKIPSWKDASRYWAQALPPDYSFARGDLSTNLAKFYPNVSIGAMEDILRQSTEFITPNQPRLIAYSEHIKRAIEKYGLSQ